MITIGKKNRFRVAVAHIKVANAILFLLYSRQFMLFNDIILIIIYRNTPYNSCLGISVHSLAINIQHRFGFFHENSLGNKPVDVGCRLLIYLVIVIADLIVQINFCTANMITSAPPAIPA